MGFRDEILADLVPEMALDLAEAVEEFTIERDLVDWDSINNKPISLGKDIIKGKGFYTSFSLQEQQAIEILHGDVKFTIPSFYERPLIGEILEIKGDFYNVINIVISPADVVYTVQLRRIGS